MILFLNTSGFEENHFVLSGGGGKIFQQKVKVNRRESQKTLGMLKKFLESKKAIGKITKIYVVSGPGSFNGIRSGVAIALAFGFGWNLPVYALTAAQIPRRFSSFPGAKKISADFDPEYGSAPKITKEKIKKLRNT